MLKVLVALVVLAAISQTPFIYRRHRLAKLDAAIRALNSQRAATDDAGLADYKGAIHVHSSLGGHSTGTLAEIVAGARAAGLNFVVMTEHPSSLTDTRAATLSGTHDGVLFVPGNETSESERDRLLTFGGAARAPASDGARAADSGDGSTRADDVSTRTNLTPAQANSAQTQALIDRAKAAGDLVFVAHPETFESWQTARGFDGMEVYNLHADAAHVNKLAMFFDGLWSYRSFAPLLWTRFYTAPAENLQRWDELTAGGRRLVAVAGNDAHANVGLSLQDLTGRPLFQIKLDPYERSFSVVRTHALVPRDKTFDTRALLDALAAGHAYVSFDLLCDATGFRFAATNGTESDGSRSMGDEIALAGGVRLRVTTPVESRVVLIKDGKRFDEKVGREAEWAVGERGVYRVECYLPQLPAPLDSKPWIISNPIYVR
ncbi:MAG: CehA/McbA family metallohydrolase [Acidobacteriota bacterium]|nr:CehA/McbA family metallohydrolase [Acidobacteriota bacterium]